MNAVVKQAAPLARIIECTEAEYFADPCVIPSLSQSIAHKMVSRSPLHGWTAHPRLGKTPDADEDDSVALNDGKIIHRLLLGKGSDIVVCPFNDFRTNLAKAMRDEALLNGKVPVIEHKYAEIAATADILRGKLSERGYSLEGQAEIAIAWEEQGEHGPVLCRGRMDLLQVGDSFACIFDLKKIKNAHPLTISKHIYEYGYDIQRTAYLSAVSKLKPELANRISFEFLFFELEPPYAITPVRNVGAFDEIGHQRWERAVLLWERCLRTNRWPEYCTEPVAVEPPPYVMNMEIGNDW